MNQNKFLQNIEETYAKAVSIVRTKNSDYAVENDPWKNFRFAQLVGVGVDKAILVRISDKLARISNCIDKRATGGSEAVKDETVEDTIVDAINYLAILKASLDNGKKTS